MFLKINQSILNMCGGEEKFFVGLKQLQISLSTSLWIKPHTGLLSGYSFRPLYFLSVPLSIFSSLPFSIQRLPHFPFGNKMKFFSLSHPGHFVIIFYGFWLLVSFHPVELMKKCYCTKIVPSLRRSLMSAITIIIMNNTFISYVNVNGFFSPAKMFEKDHPIERTTNVPKSQWLQNDIIWHLNGRRAEILSVPSSGFLTGWRGGLAALRDIFTHTLLSFLGEPTKENYCPSEPFSLSSCRIGSFFW